MRDHRGPHSPRRSRRQKWPYEWRLTTEVQGDSHTCTRRVRGGPAPPPVLQRAVLSIGRLGAASADYYLRAVAGGAEDYYLRAGEEPGRWLGDRRRWARPGWRGRRRPPAGGPGWPRPGRRDPAGARARGKRSAHTRLRPDLLGAQVGLAAGGAWARGRARPGRRRPPAGGGRGAGLPGGERRLPSPRGRRGDAGAGDRPGGRLLHPSHLARGRPCPSQPRPGGQHGKGSRGPLRSH